MHHETESVLVKVVNDNLLTWDCAYISVLLAITF